MKRYLIYFVLVMLIFTSCMNPNQSSKIGSITILLPSNTAARDISRTDSITLTNYYNIFIFNSTHFYIFEADANTNQIDALVPFGEYKIITLAGYKHSSDYAYLLGTAKNDNIIVSSGEGSNISVVLNRIGHILTYESNPEVGQAFTFSITFDSKLAEIEVPGFALLGMGYNYMQNDPNLYRSSSTESFQLIASSNIGDYDLSVIGGGVPSNSLKLIDLDYGINKILSRNDISGMSVLSWKWIDGNFLDCLSSISGIDTTTIKNNVRPTITVVSGTSNKISITITWA